MTDCSPSLLIDTALPLHALLGEARGRFDVDSIAQCESTSSLLLERAEQALVGSVIVADQQTAGRGVAGAPGCRP